MSVVTSVLSYDIAIRADPMTQEVGGIGKPVKSIDIIRRVPQSLERGVCVIAEVLPNEVLVEEWRLKYLLQQAKAPL